MAAQPDLLKASPQFKGCDINPQALQATKDLIEYNSKHAGVDLASKTILVESNLCSALQQSDAGAIDIIIFNPPYVATEDTELADAQTKKGIEAAWAGGKDGI